jgi:Putative rhamnosyl transferase
MRIQHIVETRFSIQMSAERSFAPGWLEERLELLRRFCLPSIAAQTNSEFTWALFCDERTDGEALARLDELATAAPEARIVMTAGLERGIDEGLAELIDLDADVLITTRFDSDDAIADRYLEAVREYAAPFHRSRHPDLLVNFPRGYRLDAGRGELFGEWMNCSSFHSLLERPREGRVRTVMHGGHGRLHHEHPTQQDESLAAWAIVVHGGNAINRIRAGMPRVELTGNRIPGFTLAPDALSG